MLYTPNRNLSRSGLFLLISALLTAFFPSKALAQTVYYDVEIVALKNSQTTTSFRQDEEIGVAVTAKDRDQKATVSSDQVKMTIYVGGEIFFSNDKINLVDGKAVVKPLTINKLGAGLIEVISLNDIKTKGSCTFVASPVPAGSKK